MREVGTPAGPEEEDTYAYSLEEITRLLAYLPQPAHTIAAVAAFTGAAPFGTGWSALGKLFRRRDQRDALGVGGSCR